MKSIISVLFVSIFLSNLAFATVGGPQGFNVLGWDPAQNKVYLEYYYHGESGITPDLVTYDLSSRELTIERPDFLRPLAGEGTIEIYNKYGAFYGDIRKRLKPLEKTDNLSAKISFRRVAQDEFYLPPSVGPAESCRVPYWKYEVTVAEEEGELNSFHLSNYIRDNIGVRTAFDVPGKAVQFIVIKYDGIWFETGYTKEYLVVVPREKKRIIRSFDPEMAGIKTERLTLYGENIDTGTTEVKSYVVVPRGLTLENKMYSIAKALSDEFSSLPVWIAKIVTEDGKKIAVVNLQEHPWNRGKSYDKTSGGSWRYCNFQGSTGGSYTSTVLKETFLQKSYQGEWIDGVRFLLDGEPIREGEWDHISLFGTIYRKGK